MPNKLIFGTYLTSIKFDVYILCFYFPVIQFYDCDLNKDLYWLLPTIVWLQSLTCQN